MGFFIVLSGDELTEGRLRDGNGAFLARCLVDRGWRAGGMAIVGDDPAALRGVLSRAMSEHEAVVVSGGLGGTADDLTRFALAEALDSPLELKAEALAGMEAFWKRLGRQVPSDRPLEAMMPRIAEVVPNNAGLAPGILVRRGRGAILCLPGVPSELRHMVEEGALDLLGSPEESVATMRLGVTGIREPVLASLLGDIMERGRNPLCGIAAEEGEVHLTLRARAPSRAEAEAMLARDREWIRGILQDRLFTEKGEHQVDVVVRELQERGQTLAVAESLTGGLIGHMLTEIPGVSSLFRGGCVAYANEVKVKILGVREDDLERHGAVSEVVARAMARGVRDRLGADWGIATTGIAGPGGGSTRKPVGTCWVAVSDGLTTWAERKCHGGARDEVKRRAATHTLDLLRRAILGQAGAGTPDGGIAGCS